MAARRYNAAPFAQSANCERMTNAQPALGNFAPQAAPSLALGVIGNCAFSALTDERGRMVWCCLPRFVGDPVLNALLDTSDKGSEFAIEIEDFSHAQQWYEPNTAVLRTLLYDHSGQAVENCRSCTPVFRALALLQAGDAGAQAQAYSRRAARAGEFEPAL